MNEPPTKRRRPKRNLLNFTLAGLPEMRHFDSPEDRQAALWEISDEAGRPTRGGFWLAVLAILVAVISARFLAGWLLSYVSWPTLVEETLQLASLFIAFGLVIRWLHRSGAATELRQKLLARGVPVCMKCGYLLRGLDNTIGRCPECGREFDEDVRRILGGVQRNAE